MPKTAPPIYEISYNYAGTKITVSAHNPWHFKRIVRDLESNRIPFEFYSVVRGERLAMQRTDAVRLVMRS